MFIDPTANIHPSCKIGPNASIGAHVTLAAGCRVLDSILLEGCSMDQNAVCVGSIIGEDCKIGAWARVEGVPEELEKNNKAVAILGPSDHPFPARCDI